MIKYRLTYRSHDDTPWRVDFDVAGYSGDVIPVKGVSESACTIEYTGETDNPYSPFVETSAEIAIWNEGQINVTELQKFQDRDVVVLVYRDNVLFWKGFMIPDGVQNSFKAMPQQLTLSATDGLSMLETMEYTHNNIPGLTSTPVRAPMNFIRQILFATTNLGLPLPIRWTVTLENTAFLGQDVLTGGVRWSPRGEGFSSYQKNSDGSPVKSVSCAFILKGILKSFQARLYQTGGKWVIRRVNDVVSGTFPYKEIAGDLGVMVPTTGTDTVLKTIGRTGYPFIREDAVTTVKKGLKGVTVTYESTVRENILPNGNMDIVSFAQPIYWGFQSANAQMTSVAGIMEQSEYAVEITYPSQGQSRETTFRLVDNISFAGGLPLDSKLFKKIRFGFTFCPLNGFTFNSGTGFIDWSTKPLGVQLAFNDGVTGWSLNEFGNWVNTETIIYPTVEGMKIGDVATVDFTRNREIILPPIQNYDGTNLGLYVFFYLKEGQKYILDSVYVTTEENNEVYEAFNSSTKNTDFEEQDLQISSSLNGFMVSNYMSGWYNSDIERKFKDGDFYTGTLTGVTAKAMMRFRYLPSIIFNGSINGRGKNWTFDEIYEIDMLSGLKFLPLNAQYNTETAEVNNLVAIECRNDSVLLGEKIYGTNDEQLSN